MESISRVALTFLLNAVWQIFLIACVAALLARLMKNAPAAYRHWIWVMALGLSVLLPIASVRHSGVTTLWRTQSEQTDRISQWPDWKWLPAGPASHSRSQAERTLGKSATGLASSAGGLDSLWPRTRFIPFVPYLGFLALACYLASTLFHARRLGMAWNATNEIRRAAYAQPLPASMAAVAARCRATLGLPEIPIFCSRHVRGPVTLGASHPAIILPESLFQEVSQADLASIFAHEMAHISRHDYAMNLFYRLLALPISFHPGAALLLRRIGETRELACDELASDRLTDAAEYARSLVALARKMAAAPAYAGAGYTLGVFDAHILEERVMRLLNQRSLLSPRLSKAMLAIGTCLFAVSCIFASAFSLGLSEESKSKSDDALRPFVGTWQAHLKGKPYVIASLDIADHKLAGKVTFYHVILDENGNPVDTTEGPNVCPVTGDKVEGKNLTLSGDCPGGHPREFAIRLTGERELNLRVLGVPPPPEESDGLKLTKEPEHTGEIPNAVRPFLGTWQATFAGHSFMTLTLNVAGDKLTGTMSPCRIELDASGKLTSAERGSEGGGWHIIDAKVDGSKLSVKAKEDASGDVDAFEMSLTGSDAAQFMPTGTPVPVEPWPMMRSEDKAGSDFAAPPPPPPPPTPRLASLDQYVRPALAGQALKGLDFSGRWELDPAKSSLPPDSPQSLTQRIEAKGAELKIATSSRDWQAGQPIPLTLFALTIPELTITPDNTESTQRFGPGELQTKSHWENGNLVTDWKLKRDGAEVMAGEWTRSLSKDRKTLTLKITANDSQGGGGEATLVFTRTSKQ